MKPLEKPAETEQQDNTKAQFLVSKKKTKKMRGKSLARNDADYIKIGAFAVPGKGKTYAIISFLLAGLKVVVISTDVGGSGIRTVKLALRQQGRSDLLSNLVEIEIPDYESMVDFLEDPNGAAEFELENGSFVTISQFDPDLIVWEGFSNWQNNRLRAYVLSLAPGTKGSTEARNEGLRAELQDWDSIKAGTNDRLDMFLQLHDPLTGKKWHKYVTFHEAEPKENTLTGEMLRDPMITGAARKNIAAGFDIMIHMTSEKAREKGQKPTYWYTIESDKSLTKSRGFVFPPKMEADMGFVWAEMQRQLQEGKS